MISKLNALLGDAECRLGVPFTNVDSLVATCSQLHGAGYQRMGREQLYSGVTGEPLDGRSFMGSVFYQRLRHMVVDKGMTQSLFFPC